MPSISRRARSSALLHRPRSNSSSTDDEGPSSVDGSNTTSPTSSAPRRSRNRRSLIWTSRPSSSRDTIDWSTPDLSRSISCVQPRYNRMRRIPSPSTALAVVVRGDSRGVQIADADRLSANVNTLLLMSVAGIFIPASARSMRRARRADGGSAIIRRGEGDHATLISDFAAAYPRMHPGMNIRATFMTGRMPSRYGHRSLAAGPARVTRA